jgi:hypothetical protein
MIGFRYHFRKCDDWSSRYWLCHDASSRMSCTGLPGVAATNGAHNVVIIDAVRTFTTHNSRL